MRSHIRGSMSTILACLLAGLNSAAATKPPATTEPSAGIMPFAGANVLRLVLTADEKSAAKEGFLHVDAPKMEVQVWLVESAKSVDDAVGQVPAQIVSEFKDFKADHTTDLTIAGGPAKRMTGAGHEADDGDPGEADVIVFKVGDHFFVAATHGESVTATAHQGLLTLVKTAGLP